MSVHVHHFRRVTFGNRWRFPVTGWRCACGIENVPTEVARALEGRAMT